MKNKNKRKLDEAFKILAKIRDESFDLFHSIAGVREMNNHYDEYK